MLPFRLHWQFPNLIAGEFEVVSEATKQYNCVAWALEDDTKWWDTEPDGYWPASVSREWNLANLLRVFELQGFSLCDNDDLEEEFEKIAVYTRQDGTLTHVARQRPNGVWTSKLGQSVDIDHLLHGLEDPSPGANYGIARVFLRRLRGG